MKVDAIDHIVLTVRDIDATCDFYQRVLGMEALSFGEGRRALRFGSQKINLHPYGSEFEPKAEHPTPGSADLCFVTGSDSNTIADHLAATGIAIEEGPVARTGALGPITSFYFRDPDGNLVELSSYQTSE